MHIERLKIKEFRNLKDFEIRFTQTVPVNVSREIELYFRAKSRCTGGGNPAAKQIVRDHLIAIQSMLKSSAELSSVAKWCLLFRNELQLLRLAA